MVISDIALDEGQGTTRAQLMDAVNVTSHTQWLD